MLTASVFQKAQDAKRADLNAAVQLQAKEMFNQLEVKIEGKVHMAYWKSLNFYKQLKKMQMRIESVVCPNTDHLANHNASTREVMKCYK